jgi:predicted oxidoreductase
MKMVKKLGLVSLLLMSSLAHAFSENCNEEVDASLKLHRGEPGFYQARIRANDCIVAQKSRDLVNEINTLASQQRVLDHDQAELERVLQSDLSIVGTLFSGRTPRQLSADNNRLRGEITATERRIKNLETLITGFRDMRREAAAALAAE